MQPVQKEYDVGVIVGRFQVPDLHEGHIDLIDNVVSQHQKIIIFLGLSPTKSTRNNPLDFEARKNMILARYPNIIVLYIDDSPSDKIWSKKLDNQIGHVTSPGSTVVLYGSRDSFIKHYDGRYDTYELAQKVYVSGSEIRKQVNASAKTSRDFRLGAIVTVYNQYPHVFPTIDVAIWNEDHTELLMARKEEESKYRFIGGFADKTGSYEQDVRREVSEEAHIEISDPVYVGSGEVDDWRYRKEMDGIKTILFEAKYVHGRPTPDDDIVELQWIKTKDIDKQIIDTHKFLLQMLVAKYPERF